MKSMGLSQAINKQYWQYSGDTFILILNVRELRFLVKFRDRKQENEAFISETILNFLLEFLVIFYLCDKQKACNHDVHSLKPSAWR